MEWEARTTRLSVQKMGGPSLVVTLVCSPERFVSDEGSHVSIHPEPSDRQRQDRKGKKTTSQQIGFRCGPCFDKCYTLGSNLPKNDDLHERFFVRISLYQ